MYLKKVIIENVGPIEKIDFELPFDGDNPKPLILVGENGKGKSNFLSYIFDAIFEFHKQYFTNMPKEYFRYSGGNNTKLGKTFLLSYLLFESNGKDIEYIDKNGEINIEKTKELLSTNFDNLLNISSFGEGNFKSITNIKINKELEKDIKNNSYGYFPASRNETPNWLNRNSLDKESFSMKNFISGVLEKEILLETSLSQNKKWLLDIVLDHYHKYGETVEIWNAVNLILGSILGDDKFRLGIGNRNNFSRISIVKDLANRDIEQILPSINCLSQGESVLFNLFISIIKLSDNFPKKIEEITGIIIIDEIDLHLHSKLQKEILPKLIKLFSKVQFIITTHSPLFVLGMEETFGVDRIQIREMPNGEIITAERFKEFEKAFEYLTKTKTFEEEIEAKIKESGKKNILLVEGEIEEKILKKIFGIECDFEIIWPGSGADNLANYLIGKSFLEDEYKILGLFDKDDAGKEGGKKFEGKKRESTTNVKKEFIIPNEGLKSILLKQGISFSFDELLPDFVWKYLNENGFLEDATKFDKNTIPHNKSFDNFVAETFGDNETTKLRVTRKVILNKKGDLQKYLLALETTEFSEIIESLKPTTDKIGNYFRS